MTPSATLPRRRDGSGHAPYRIAVVCLGNICRSPIAGTVLRAHIASAGLADRVVVDSAGTGDWHVGQPMDERAVRVLTAAGYDASRHRARLAEAHWLAEHDLVLAMDADNRADLEALGVPADRLRMFRQFDPERSQYDVPDPYYGGADGFEEVLRIVERTSAALTDELAGLLDRC